MRRASVRFVTRRLALALLTVVLLLAACGQTSGEDGASEITQADGQPVADGVADTSGAGSDTAPTDAATPVPSATPEPVVEPTAATPVPSATPEPVVEPTAATIDEPVAEEAESPAESDGLFPIVVDAMASSNDGASWRFDVTLSSEYDSPARYADAWRVLDADDNELGIRVLGHDHANEQPFTRSATVEVPAGITTVFIEGRDQLNGWSGERFELALS